uniref:EfbA n=1 Tax=Arundo donax TaxID=35708 RepID=A0A0A9F1Q0_ARUDO
MRATDSRTDEVQRDISGDANHARLRLGRRAHQHGHRRPLHRQPDGLPGARRFLPRGDGRPAYHRRRPRGGGLRRGRLRADAPRASPGDGRARKARPRRQQAVPQASGSYPCPVLLCLTDKNTCAHVQLSGEDAYQALRRVVDDGNAVITMYKDKVSATARCPRRRAPWRSRRVCTAGLSRSPASPSCTRPSAAWAK